VLLVTRLDRLARSTRDLLNVLATVTDKGAGFRLMLTVLGGLQSSSGVGPTSAIERPCGVVASPAVCGSDGS
jgi:DNA invertase Pin-like site-specific DNA recombinase